MASTTTCCDTSTTSACTTESVLRPRSSAADHHAGRSDAHAGLLPREDALAQPDDARLGRRVRRAGLPGAGAGRQRTAAVDRDRPKGYAIGPCGDEIILDCDRTVDLRTSGVTGVAGDACVEPIDPWCSDVYNPNQPRTLFIAVRFKEVMTRPVRVQPHGCGCDDLRCESSRWRDGYDIGVLTKCPVRHWTRRRSSRPGRRVRFRRVRAVRRRRGLASRESTSTPTATSFASTTAPVAG